MLNISVYPSLLGVDPDLDRIIYRSESFNVYFKVEKTPNTHLLTGTRILRRRTAEGLISTSTTRNAEKLKRRVGRLSASLTSHVIVSSVKRSGSETFREYISRLQTKSVKLLRQRFEWHTEEYEHSLGRDLGR